MPEIEKEESVSSQDVHRRLSAIVSVDVAGYSRLMGIDEEGTHAALKSLRDELLNPKIASMHGRVVKTTGDGMLIEFASVVDAVTCFIDIQQEMSERNLTIPEDRKIWLRVGINVGDIIIDDEDIFGDGVNVAARLEGIAAPGGICFSRAVRDQVQQKLNLDLEDLGHRALKNIEEPVHAYQILRTSDNVERRPSASTAAQVAEVYFTQRPSIAILSFKNLNGDTENDFIADGIALGIQTLLVQLSGLFLINAISHQDYRSGQISGGEAVKDLPVRYILEGTTQRFGERIRVTVQLTDLQANAITWAENFDRDLEDVFALQDEITRRVTTSLNIELYRRDLERILLDDLAGDGAWEYFLRGVSHVYKFNKIDNAKAREMFQRLLDLRPEKVQGPGYLALTHWLDATRGWSDAPAESLSQARSWAEKALTYKNNDGLGHVVMSFLRLHEGAHEEALALSRQASDFRANCPAMLGQMATVQLYCGDPRGAIKSARESLAVRTVYPPMIINLLAAAYRDAGEFGYSIAAALEATRYDGSFIDALATLCTDYGLSGNEAKAKHIGSDIMAIDPNFRVSDYATKHPYRDQGVLSRLTTALQDAGLPD